ncbi:hypothetical protein ACFW81_02525 [Streptomyces angustmyceticus]|uniref:hypothetical protein n=1 Tax=Streptomyces angustmyceticus TaxID=285578 RepID=UPI0036829AAB
MFKAEQKVKFSGMAMPATIISGPHPTHGADRWLIRKADETVSLVKTAELSPILSRREVVAKAIYSHAGVHRWETVSWTTRIGYLRMADEVLTALDVVTTDERARSLQAGDRIRILRSGLEFANVRVGDILTVMAVRENDFKTNAPASPQVGDQWTFALNGEGKGWERV